MLITDCRKGQRVALQETHRLYAEGCRTGHIFHVGATLVAVKFDYRGHVAGLHPSDLTPA